ncbi:MAG: hypothetical protein WC417_02080 [Candidatus Omnitrophota bacterium]|jgi:hypothetical protein
MNKNNEIKKTGKIRVFFGKLFEKLDKEMQEKANAKPCCCKPSDKAKNSCCSK